MEPRIQYTKTEDGVSIAYSALGDGMPLVLVPSSEFSHIQAEWQLPGASSYYERLASSVSQRRKEGEMQRLRAEFQAYRYRMPPAVAEPD